ncbi:MAG TPA: UDP-N-acetylmuramoyl-tripeptide--D-alanyl-D-alanine ligase [Pyrinomonadaceae bacterium]|nr:UDP-N-acetylmuramoyl-tripeptide--D-alanyl-D-alanine ligase [Pyrinomonadaceae bacterium]
MFDKEIRGFSIDSRTAAGGELFFALSPPDYARHGFTGSEFTDAHRFIPQALSEGVLAAVALRERVRGDAELEALRGRLLLVDDCIGALQELAHGVVTEWGRPVVGITGSAGKTTTKDLAAHVLGVSGRRVLRSKKNYNNELGLPLSVLQMVSEGGRPDEFDVAVLEMGMSTPKEIARLCEIAPPDVGVELLVAPAHLEFFGTIEAIAESKAQLVEGLKPGGTAVLNADDERVAAMRSRHTTGPVMTFGIENPSDVTAVNIEGARLGLTRFVLRTPLGESEAELAMPGRHNLMNALAAAAVATCFGVRPEEIAEALRTAAPSEMRGEVLRFRAGFTVLDDSYNSNPRSLLSMVESVAQGGGGVKRKLVVAGEMLELGPGAASLHREAGREIANLGVDVLWGVRGLASEIVAGAREAGMAEEATRLFESSDEAAAALADELREGDLVLVKGSRGVQTDRVVKLLKTKYELSR